MRSDDAAGSPADCDPGAQSAIRSKPTVNPDLRATKKRYRIVSKLPDELAPKAKSAVAAAYLIFFALPTSRAILRLENRYVVATEFRNFAFTLSQSSLDVLRIVNSVLGRSVPRQSLSRLLRLRDRRRAIQTFLVKALIGA